MRQLHPSTTHIVAAYILKNSDGYQDDREFGAGYRIKDYMVKNAHSNVAVFMVRYHAGPNIDPKQHRLYEKAAVGASSCHDLINMHEHP